MNKLSFLTFAALLSSSLASQAQGSDPAPAPEHSLTGNLSLVSDYRFRGISQTWALPAVQGRGLEMRSSTALTDLVQGEATVLRFTLDGKPAADLAVLLAIVSSLTDRALPGKLAVFGEVGLAGEVRPAPRGQERLREAAKLGFTQAIIPMANKPRQKIEGIEVIAVDRVADALARFRG